MEYCRSCQSSSTSFPTSHGNIPPQELSKTPVKMVAPPFPLQLVSIRGTTTGAVHGHGTASSASPSCSTPMALQPKPTCNWEGLPVLTLELMQGKERGVKKSPIFELPTKSLLSLSMKTHQSLNRKINQTLSSTSSGHLNPTNPHSVNLS